MPSFKFEGQRIAYTEYGGGPAAVDRGGRTRGGPPERAGGRTAADPRCTGCCSPRRCTARWPKTWRRAATA